MRTPPHAAVVDFATLASGYAALIEGHESLSARELLAGVHAFLPRLYSAALVLPDLSPLKAQDPEPRVVAESCTMRRALAGKLGPRDEYREIFDPYKHDVEVRGSIADDLTDIYHDLLPGLSHYQLGEFNDAAWSWRLAFQTHWGEHATGALRAIHTLAYTYDQ